uniref:Protein KAKU4 n=1 Tax=Zea mays TaxID=4577 RepID=A0A804R4W3_MAIZE
MESSAVRGDTPRRPSAFAGASPPPPPPPPPRGWLAGLVSGAGRILAAVLGPEPSSSGSGSIASSAASDGDSPSASYSPAWFPPPGPHGEGCNDATDNNDSPVFPLSNNQSNQGKKETALKDYTGSLAIISEIEPKDAIMQLLMQETYSRSECSKFIKIIQERVLDSDSGDIDAGGFALTSARKASRLAVDGYSSFSPHESSPATSSLQMHGCDNSAAVGTIPKLTHTNQSPFINNAKNINPVLKRNYSVREDPYGEIRRVRPKINGNSWDISKFKQVDIIRNHPAANSREELTARNPNASRDGKKLLKDIMGASNLTYPNFISKAETADETSDVPDKPSAVTPQQHDSSFPQAGKKQKGFAATTLNQCSNEKGFALKVEPLNAFIPFEQQMMDLSHRKQENAACDDSCSLSKLMLKEDIEAAPSLPTGIQVQNGSKNRRRRQPNVQKTTATPTRSPARGQRRKNNDAMVKSEMGLIEQSKLVLTEQEPELGDVPVKRPVGRPRKARNGPSSDDPGTPAS